ncbi:MAG: alpha/beta hydrolase [Proteobacteria bacterium]|nr:alpha/beta hydrolase [Pseudomonadota bacterium]
MMKVMLSAAIAASVVFVLAQPATAQMSANPPEVAKKIREMGPRLSPEIIRTTGALYRPLHEKAPKDGVKISKDLVYGPHERHRLDLFQSESASATARPIVVFLHGGGYVRGDKRGSGNIGIYFARHDMVGITINYRLAPAVKWPAGAQDIARLIGWIRANPDKHGGNIDKIFLMGNSAGTGHVASYVFFEDHQVKGADGVAGAILVSGPSYDTRLMGPRSGAYFGEDRSKYPGMSVIKTIDGRKIPLFIAYAELDMPAIQKQNHVLINALYERDGMMPTVKQVMGHNHISIVQHINTKDESLGPDLLEFIRTH